MKKLLFVVLVITMLVAFQVTAFGASEKFVDKGFNEEGYNYNAHLYVGDFLDNGDKLVMKWNDAWLSNKDRDEDGELDRHYGYDSYIGSGAWVTNHWSGTYVEDGKKYKWTYFIKIVAVPEDATLEDDVWYSADDSKIGPEIWGQFAIVQEVSNDSGTGDHGLISKGTIPALGNWDKR